MSVCQVAISLLLSGHCLRVANFREAEFSEVRIAPVQALWAPRALICFSEVVSRLLVENEVDGRYGTPSPVERTGAMLLTNRRPASSVYAKGR